MNNQTPKFQIVRKMAQTIRRLPSAKNGSDRWLIQCTDGTRINIFADASARADIISPFNKAKDDGIPFPDRVGQVATINREILAQRNKRGYWEYVFVAHKPNIG